MLQAIKQFFEQNIANQMDADEKGSEHALQLASTALLFEMMRMDEEQHPKEQALIQDLIRKQFSLSAKEAEQLLALAEKEASQSTDYHQFTRLINEQFTPEQKIKLVEHLWQIAYADGHLDKYEEYLVRRIADLLHIPHQAFIRAKHRAAARAGSQ